MADNLESLYPAEALELNQGGRDDPTGGTVEGQKYRLRAFVSWCDEERITDTNDISGRDLYRSRVWRREGGYTGEETKPGTLRGDLAALRTRPRVSRRPTSPSCPHA